MSWSIRPGYEVYRASIKVRPLDAGITIAAPLLPDGAAEDDPYFGKVRVLTGRVSASIPYAMHGPGPRVLRFEVGFRGCHVTAPQFCFPPITTIVNVPVRANGGGIAL